MLESVILRKFRSSSGIAADSGWFRISDNDEDEMTGKMDRAGEVRMLQHLLENSHETFYRLEPGINLTK